MSTCWRGHGGVGERWMMESTAMTDLGDETTRPPPWRYTPCSGRLKNTEIEQ